jgi:tRNA (cmo5U34)-methyltransferase
MLEKMSEFFERRLDGYDEHMLTCIESAEEFYPFTAAQLPQGKAKVLDLGCGTGLELEYYLSSNPQSEITGVDLAPEMLKALENKLSGKNLKLILGSYFDVPFGEKIYDAAVSVESLHHFTKAEKIPLYKKIFYCLTWPTFDIIDKYTKFVALFVKVGWKPIPHTSTVKIEDINKK